MFFLQNTTIDDIIDDDLEYVELASDIWDQDDDDGSNNHDRDHDGDYHDKVRQDGEDDDDYGAS